MTACTTGESGRPVPRSRPITFMSAYFTQFKKWVMARTLTYLFLIQPKYFLYKSNSKKYRKLEIRFKGFAEIRLKDIFITLSCPV